MSDIKVEVTQKHAAKTIGEGPHWEERTGKLLYVDINAADVHRWDSNTGQVESVHIGDGSPVGVIVPTSTPDEYIVASGRKLCRLNWQTKETKDIAEVPVVGTYDRFNDGKCDPRGRFLAGTMGLEKEPGVPEMNTGRLFTLENDKIRTTYSPVSISNGLAWSFDHKIMYYIDSAPRLVYAFDYDIETGVASNKRDVIDFKRWPVDDSGYPDGMTIDQEGKLWIACYLGGKVMRVDPATGTRIQDVLVPGKRTTSCCFGGPDYSELYITSCVTGWTEEQMKKLDPLAGSNFKVIGLGVKGALAPNYSG